MPIRVVYLVAILSLFCPRIRGTALAQTDLTFPGNHHAAAKTLDLSASLFSPVEKTGSGFSPETTAVLAYGRRAKRLTLGARGAATVRPDLQYSGFSSLAFEAAPRLTVHVQGASSVAPYFAIVPAAG